MLRVVEVSVELLWSRFIHMVHSQCTLITHRELQVLRYVVFVIYCVFRVTLYTAMCDIYFIVFNFKSSRKCVRNPTKQECY